MKNSAAPAPASAPVSGGMVMMLKAFGIDINEIMKVAGEAQEMLKHFDDRLARIEAAQQTILQQLGVNENVGRELGDAASRNLPNVNGGAD